MCAFPTGGGAGALAWAPIGPGVGGVHVVTSSSAPPRPAPGPPRPGPGGPAQGPPQAPAQGPAAPPSAPRRDSAALVRARRRRAAVTAFARTSPGQLLLGGVLLVVACLLAGTVAATSVSGRTTELAAQLARTEPVAAAGQELYAALSEADASAAAAFLSGGLEPAGVRDDYTAAVARGASALATASAGAGDDAATREQLARLTAQLPVYTGLVETARANNRQGNPVGAAYLREASTLMQVELLPAAEGIYRDQSAAVTASQSAATGVPWLAVVLGLLALVLLLLGLRLLARRTRRVVNPGLAAAAVATALWLGWLVVASGVAGARVDDARTDGSAQLDLFAQSRILAQQARADETLALVSRGDGPGYQQSFLDGTAALDDLLSRAETDADEVAVRSAATTARSAAARWVGAHARIVTASEQGEYAGAVRTAIGDDPGDSTAAFDDLGTALGGAITSTEATLRTDTAGAGSAYTGLAPAAVVLSVLAAAAVAAGLWPRLREYQ